MLEDKIKESEALSIKCNDLLNEKEISEIKFEEEKNKLKNLKISFLITVNHFLGSFFHNNDFIIFSFLHFTFMSPGRIPNFN